MKMLFCFIFISMFAAQARAEAPTYDCTATFSKTHLLDHSGLEDKMNFSFEAPSRNASENFEQELPKFPGRHVYAYAHNRDDLCPIEDCGMVGVWVETYEGPKELRAKVNYVYVIAQTGNERIFASQSFLIDSKNQWHTFLNCKKRK